MHPLHVACEPPVANLDATEIRRLTNSACNGGGRCGSAQRGERVALHVSVERFAPDGDVEMSIGHGERERGASLEAGDEIVEQRPRDSIDYDRVGAVNSAAGELASELRRV